jgi:hypothetical protein
VSKTSVKLNNTGVVLKSAAEKTVGPWCFSPPLRHHGFGHPDEASDTGPGGIIAGLPVAVTGSEAGAVGLPHYVPELVPGFSRVQ